VHEDPRGLVLGDALDGRGVEAERGGSLALEKNSEPKTRPFMLETPTESLSWMRTYCSRKSLPALPAAMALPVPLPAPAAPEMSTQVMDIPGPSARRMFFAPSPTSLTTGLGLLAGPTVLSVPGSPTSLSPAFSMAGSDIL
jgi:hypothetical protein